MMRKVFEMRCFSLKIHMQFLCCGVSRSKRKEEEDENRYKRRGSFTTHHHFVCVVEFFCDQKFVRIEVLCCRKMCSCCGVVYRAAAREEKKIDEGVLTGRRNHVAIFLSLRFDTSSFCVMVWCSIL